MRLTRTSSRSLPLSLSESAITTAPPPGSETPSLICHSPEAAGSAAASRAPATTRCRCASQESISAHLATILARCHIRLRIPPPNPYNTKGQGPCPVPLAGRPGPRGPTVNQPDRPPPESQKKHFSQTIRQSGLARSPAAGQKGGPHLPLRSMRAMASSADL